MERYKALKGNSLLYLIMVTLLYNALFIVIIKITNSYELDTFLKAAFVIVNIYQLYYIFLSQTLNYTIDDKNIKITAVWGLKKIVIPTESIQGYNKSSGSIRGVKIYGYGKNTFALCKSIVDKIGLSSMYATSNKNIFYLKTDDISYGISPENYDEFERKLNSLNISLTNWKYSRNKNYNLHKDKKFIIPFILATIVIVVLTINPFILYLTNKLPSIMPLNFDANFMPLKNGNGKQFAFKQMMYGVLNMALLFFMYYASYFYAKYDKKSSYKFIYIVLFISSIFLFMQFKTLAAFR